jgi:hypothetical protein
VFCILALFRLALQAAGGGAQLVPILAQYSRQWPPAGRCSAPQALAVEEGAHFPPLAQEGLLGAEICPKFTRKGARRHLLPLEGERSLKGTDLRHCEL